MLQTLSEMQTGEAPGPSEVSLELIAAIEAVKLLEHGMKVVERVFERRLRRIVC